MLTNDSRYRGDISMAPVLSVPFPASVPSHHGTMLSIVGRTTGRPRFTGRRIEHSWRFLCPARTHPIAVRHVKLTHTSYATMPSSACLRCRLGRVGSPWPMRGCGSAVLPKPSASHLPASTACPTTDARARSETFLIWNRGALQRWNTRRTRVKCWSSQTRVQTAIRDVSASMPHALCARQ